MSAMETTSAAPQRLIADVWLLIFRQLDLPELFALSQVNRELLHLLSGKETYGIWIKAFELKYGKILPLEGTAGPSLLPGTSSLSSSPSKLASSPTNPRMKDPRCVYAILLRRHGNLIGYHQPDFPTFRGALVRIALFADGSMQAHRIEAFNSIAKTAQKTPLSVRRSVLVDKMDLQLSHASLFRIALDTSSEDLTSIVMNCSRRPNDPDPHLITLHQGPPPLAPSVPLLTNLANFQQPSTFGLWPHPESLPPSPEDLRSSIFLGSMDDHPSVVVESLANTFFPAPGKALSRTFHLSCSLGCHLRGLRLYHQAEVPTDPSLPLPPRLAYTPTLSKLDIRSKVPLDMFPELPVTPLEGVWAATGDADPEEGRTPLSLILFRYVPADDRDFSSDSDDDMSMSDAMSSSWLSSSAPAPTGNRANSVDVDLDSVMDLAPPLSAPPPPSPRKRVQGSPVPSSSEEDVRLELRAYSITGNMRIPRGELLFRAQTWDSTTLSFHPDDDSDDEIDADETPELEGGKSYPCMVATAGRGYTAKREEEGTLVVLSEKEVAVYDSTRGERIRWFRFVC